VRKPNHFLSSSLQAYAQNKQAIGEAKRERFKSPTKFLSGNDGEEEKEEE